MTIFGNLPSTDSAPNAVQPVERVEAGALSCRTGSGLSRWSPPWPPSCPWPPWPRYDDRKEIQLGSAALKAERFVEAEHYFDHVLQDVPANEDATFLRGLARAGRGDLQGARLSFIRSILLNRDNHFARFELGMVSLRLGDRAAAVEQYQALERLERLCGRRCPDGPYIGRAILTLGAALDRARRGR
jgi:tetratricopeptide (TPR) repeat protein